MISSKRFLLCTLVLIPGLVSALPQDASVAAGSAEFSKTDLNTLLISTSDKAIINYSSFDIGTHEIVQFIQPQSSSCVLNRVQGGNPSEILGHLNANGKVFLVNPNGIYFGASSVVNTASIVASVLDIKDQDFLDEKYRFFLKSGSEKARIDVLGQINAGVEGAIVLLAPYIRNEGVLTAKAGKVVMAAGELVTLDFTGDGKIHFAVEGELKEALIEQAGKIEAADAKVMLRLRTAKRVIESIVNADGALEGSAIVEEGGEIKILSSSTILARKVGIEGDGHVTVSGQVKGGEVQILGDHLKLVGAEIDASGDFGGGTVLIGGEYQGSVGTRTAITTEMDTDSVIRADALVNGPGGRVILWSDETTLFNGDISVCAGPMGGDGGFVETSGKKYLGCMTGHVDALAPRGREGQVLMDPATVVIVAGLSGLLPLVCADGMTPTIGATTIQNFGASVTICAQSGAGTISHTSGASITMGATRSLTYTANGGTTFSGAGTTTITTSGGGGVSFSGGVGANANRVFLDAAATVNLNTGGGAVTFGSSIDGVTANDGILNVNGAGAITVTGDIGALLPLEGSSLTTLSLTGTSISLANIGTATELGVHNAVTLNATAGNITFNGNNYNAGQTFTQSYTATGSFLMSAAGTVTFQHFTTPGPSLNGATTFTTGTISLSNGVAGPNLVVDSGVSAVTLTNIIRTAGTPNVTITGSTLSMRGLGTVIGQFGTLNLAGVGGTVTMGHSAAGGNVFANTVTFSGTSSVVLRGSLSTNNTALNFPAITTLGDNTAASSSTVTITTVNGAAVGGNIDFISSVNADVVTNTRNLILNTGTMAGSSIHFFNASGVRLTTLTATAGTRIEFDLAMRIQGFNTLTDVINLTAPTIAVAFMSTELGGSITYNGNLEADVFGLGTIETGRASGSGAIAVTGTINGDAPGRFLTMNARGGPVTIGGAIGAVVPLANMSLTGTTVTLNGNIGTAILAGLSSGGSSITTTTGDITLSGTIYNTNTFNYNPIANFDLNINTAGTVFTTSNDGFAINTTGTGATRLAAGADLTVNSNGGPVTVGDIHSTGDSRTITLNSLGGIVQVGNIGTMGGTEFVSTVLNGTGSVNIRGDIYTNAITFVGAGSNISLGGSIHTSNTTVTFTKSVVLNSPASPSSVTVDTGPGAGDVIFNATLNADLNTNRRDLTITAGTGNVTFSSLVGINDELSSLTVTGANVNVNNSLETTTLGGGTGAFVVTNSGTFTKLSTGDIIAPGGFSTSGIANIAADITTTDTFLTVGGALTLSAPAGPPIHFNTGAGGAGDITLSSTVNGGQNLLLTAGTGNVTLNGAVGAVTPLTLLTASGNSIIQNSTVRTTGVTGDISYTGTAATNAIQLGGTITTSGGDVSMTGPVLLNANMSIDTTNAFAAGANITFSPSTTTIDGARTLSLLGGTGGTITMSGAIGSTTRLTSLTASGNTVIQNSSVQTTGAVTYTGLAAMNAIQLGGAITTSSGIVTTNGPILLTTPASISTIGQATTGANIIFNPATSPPTIDGATSVSLTSGVGNITFTVPVGSITPPTSMTVNNGGTLTVNNTAPIIINGPFSQIGTGPVSLGANISTFNGNIGFTGPITLTTDPITLSTQLAVGGGDISVGVVNATAVQALILNAGTGTANLNGIIGGMVPLSALTATAATIDQNATVNTTGIVTYNGVTNLGGSIFTSDSDINFNGNVQRDGVNNVTVSTGAGAGGNINFTGTITADVDSTRNLTLLAGTGDINLTGAVGMGNRLGNIVITSVATLTDPPAASIRANSLTQTNGTVSSTFDGTIDTTGNIALTSTAGGTITINNTVATGAAGAVTITNSGVLTIGSAGDMTIGGSFLQNGAGTVSTAGDINSGNGITFGAATTLTGSIMLTSVGATTFSSTLSGTAGGLAEMLTIDAGVGSVNFQTITGNGAMGLTDIFLQHSGAANFNGAVTITGTLSQTNAATGTTTFANTVSVGTANLLGTSYSVNNTFTATGAVSVVNSGVFTTSAAGLITASGGFTQTGGGSSSLGANVTTAGSANQISFLNPVLITNTISLLSGSGPITLSSPVTSNAGIARDLTITTTGAVNVNAMGASPVANYIGDLLINGPASTITTTANIFADTVMFMSAGNLFLGGNVTTNNNPITFTSPVVLTIPSPLITTETPTGAGGANITFNLTVLPMASGVQGMTVDSGIGQIDFVGAIGSGPLPLSFLTATGNTIVQNSTVDTTGAVDYTAVAVMNAIQLNGNITTRGGLATVDGSVLLNSGIVIDTTNAGMVPAGGIIDFSPATSTIDALAAGVQFLHLTAGGSNIFLSGQIGGTTRLGDLVINSAASVATVGIISTIITQTTGTGTTTFGGALNTDMAGGINLTGVNFAFNGTTNTTGGGPVNIINSGVATIANGSTMTLDGSFTQNGGVGSTVQIGANILLTSNDNITFNSPMTLTNAVTLNTQFGGAGDGNISIFSNVSGNFAFSLFGGVNAAIGTNFIELEGNLGTPVRLASFDAHGEWIDEDANCLTNGFITFGSTLLLQGGVTISSLGGPIIFNSDVVLDEAAGNAFISSAGGPITFNSTLDSIDATLRGVSLDAAAGDILFVGVVGGTAFPPNEVLITSADDVNITNTFTAGSLRQTTGTGTTTFGGAVTTTAIGGVVLGISPSTVNAVNINFPVITNAAGPVTINNAGTLTIAANITSSGAFNQSGNGAVNITAPITIMTPNPNINFNGPTTLSAGPVMFTSGTGGIDLHGTVNGAQSLTLSAIGGTIITYSDIGTMPPPLTVFSATADTICILGDLVADSITLNALVGSSVLGGDVTSSGALAFASPVLIQGTNQTFTAGAAAGITFMSTLNACPMGPCACGTGTGTTNLFLVAGANNITFSGLVGNINRPNLISITSANVVDINAALNVGSLAQTTSTTTNISAPVNTNAIGGVNLTGNAFNITSTVATTNGGPVSINNAGLLSITAGGDMSLSGAFSQTGVGAVSTAGDIIMTASAPISFASAVALTGNVLLNSLGGNITFSSTLGGGFSLTANAGAGQVHFTSAVGGVPLAALTATGGVINQDSTVNTTGDIIYTGTTQLGGNITTMGALGDITINGSVVRDTINNVTLMTGAGGNIAITGAVNGDIAGRNLTLTGGTGSVTVGGSIGVAVPLDTVVVTGNLISLGGVGQAGVGVATSITATSATNINFTGQFYTANQQTYNAPAGSFNMTAGASTTVTTFLNSNVFAPLASQINLSNGSNLDIIFGNNLNFSLNTVCGTSGENLGVSNGTGTLTLGDIGGCVPGDIGQVTAAGGVIVGTLGTTIQTTGNAIFLAQIGNVATPAVPLNVIAGGTITAGASPDDACCSEADFTGSSSDNTVHAFASPFTPCIIKFNMATVRSCIPPIFPPVVPPSSVSPGDVSVLVIPNVLFFVPGIYSPLYNLADYVYFLDDLADDKVAERPTMLMYWIPFQGRRI